MDYYTVLGIPENADRKTIRARYRDMARKLHPDLNQGDSRKTEKFKQVVEAYAVLGDGKRRAEYDRSRKTGSHPLFGPKFDDIVARVRQEGIHKGNLDDLLKDFVGFAEEMKDELPKKVAHAKASPGSLLDLIEEIFGDEPFIKPTARR